MDRRSQLLRAIILQAIALIIIMGLPKLFQMLITQNAESSESAPMMFEEIQRIIKIVQYMILLMSVLSITTLAIRYIFSDSIYPSNEMETEVDQEEDPQPSVADALEEMLAVDDNSTSSPDTEVMADDEKSQKTEGTPQNARVIRAKPEEEPETPKEQPISERKRVIRG